MIKTKKIINIKLFFLLFILDVNSFGVFDNIIRNNRLLNFKLIQDLFDILGYQL